VYIAPNCLQCHIHCNTFFSGSFNCRIQFFVHMSQSGSNYNNSFVSFIDQRINNFRMHVRIIINHRNFIFEVGQNINISVFSTVVIIWFQRFNFVSANGCQRDIANGSESGTIRGVHFANACSTMQKAVFIGSWSEHAHHNFGYVGVSGGIIGVY